MRVPLFLLGHFGISPRPKVNVGLLLSLPHSGALRICPHVCPLCGLRLFLTGQFCHSYTRSFPAKVNRLTGIKSARSPCAYSAGFCGVCLFPIWSLRPPCYGHALSVSSHVSASYPSAGIQLAACLYPADGCGQKDYRTNKQFAVGKCGTFPYSQYNRGKVKTQDIDTEKQV